MFLKRGLRNGIDDGATVDEILEGVQEGLDAFGQSVASFLMYD